jgi:hypothetical protein
MWKETFMICFVFAHSNISDRPEENITGTVVTLGHFLDGFTYDLFKDTCGKER